MSLEDTELKIGGVNLKGVWIAVVMSLATTVGGGIYGAAQFMGRIEAVEQAVAEQLRDGHADHGLHRRRDELHRAVAPMPGNDVAHVARQQAITLLLTR